MQTSMLNARYSNGDADNSNDVIHHSHGYEDDQHHFKGDGIVDFDKKDEHDHHQEKDEEEEDNVGDDVDISDHVISAPVTYNDDEEDEIEMRLRKLQPYTSPSKVLIGKAANTATAATNTTSNSSTSSSSLSKSLISHLSARNDASSLESSNSNLLITKDIQNMDNEEEEEYLQKQQQQEEEEQLQQTKQHQKQRQGNPVRDTFFAEFNEKLMAIHLSAIPLDIIESTQYPLSPLERILIETVNQGMIKIRELGDTINELVSEAEQKEKKEQRIAEQIDMENRKIKALQYKFEEIQSRNEELENVIALSHNESAIEMQRAKKEIRQLKKDFDDLEDKSRKIVKENKRLNALLEQRNMHGIVAVSDEDLDLDEDNYRRIYSSSKNRYRKPASFDEHEYELVLASNEALERQSKDLEDQLRMSKAEIKKLSGFLKEFMDHNEKQLVHLPQIQTALEEKDREIEKLKAEIASRSVTEEWKEPKSQLDTPTKKDHDVGDDKGDGILNANETSKPAPVSIFIPSDTQLSAKKISDIDKHIRVDEELYILDEACKLLSLKNSRNLIGELKRVILKARALARVKVFVNEICELVITNSDHPFSSDISITDPTISPEVLARVIPQIRAWIPRRR